MTALSDLLKDSKVAPPRAIDRIEESDEHRMDRATVYRYLEGRHPARPSERYLAALSYGFDLKITSVRAAAKVPTGELGPWKPPIESGRLSKSVRDALDELIIVLAKEGTDRGTSDQKSLEDLQEFEAEPFDADASEDATPPADVEGPT